MNNKPLTRSEVKRGISFFILLLICFISALLILFSCSSQQYATVPNSEKLFVPDVSDRKIVGVNKRQTKYKVINGKGRKAQPIRSDSIDFNKIGTIMYLLPEYDNQRY